jgi:hypothetical protein
MHVAPARAEENRLEEAVSDVRVWLSIDVEVLGPLEDLFEVLTEEPLRFV